MKPIGRTRTNTIKDTQQIVHMHVYYNLTSIPEHANEAQLNDAQKMRPDDKYLATFQKIILLIADDYFNPNLIRC